MIKKGCKIMMTSAGKKSKLVTIASSDANLGLLVNEMEKSSCDIEKIMNGSDLRNG